VTGRLVAPVASSPHARAVMVGNRRRDTRPELRLRSRLHALGLRFRVDYRIECGERGVRVDVAFTRGRVAVFVDGCFRHGCDEHTKAPKSNLDYWGPKIEGNRTRDIVQTEALGRAGWIVVRAWEHESLGEVAERVRQALATPHAAGVAEAGTSVRRGSGPPLRARARVSRDRPSRRSGVDAAARQGR
jgi:DNA mismatch endonuclease (patch repair protein)